MVEGGPEIAIELAKHTSDTVGQLVSSGERSGVSGTVSAKNRKRSGKKDKKKGRSKSKGVMKSVAASGAIIMAEDEIEEHAEAMDMI